MKHRLKKKQRQLKSKAKKAKIKKILIKRRRKKFNKITMKWTIRMMSKP